MEETKKTYVSPVLEDIELGIYTISAQETGMSENFNTSDEEEDVN